MTDTTRDAFEAHAAPMGFDLTRQYLAVPEPWAEYVNEQTGYFWAGYQAATEQDKPQWLSIADGLPAPMVDVLCLAKQINTGEFEIKQSCVNPVGTGFYVEYDEVGNAPIEEVTHWQPLPLPPTATPQGKI